MSAQRDTDPTPETGERTPEQIRADIEKTRQELGDTVEALAAETDVKAQAAARVASAKAQAREVAQNARANLPASPGVVAGVAGGLLAGLLIWRRRRG